MATQTKARMKTRKIVHGESRLLIAKVYHFLKEEFEFTVLYKEPNCDISHLRNITMRTAEATGVSKRTVQKILKEERDMKKKQETSTSSKSTKKESKGKKGVRDPDDAGTVSKLATESTDIPVEEKLSSTNTTESTNKVISENNDKKRKVVHSEGREMIASIYFFLKGEYEVTDLYREPNADFTHLRNITRRTAEAAGVSERTVQKILKEERDVLKSGDANAGTTSPKKTIKKATTKKRIKKEKENKKGKKKRKLDEATTSSKIPKKRGKKGNNVQNTHEASTSENLPSVETNINPPPPPPLFLPPPIDQ